MKIIGNIIWLLFGGIFIAIEYLLSSLFLFFTIIGIPFGLQTLKLSLIALWPFGTKIEDHESAHGCLSTFMNVLWFFVGGIWIALTHFLFGLFFFITIIGIPFGVQHFKLAAIALTPFGHKIVYKS